MKNSISTKIGGGGRGRVPDIIKGILENDFNEIKSAIKISPSCINKQDSYGRTAAMYAAMAKGHNLFKWLSEQEGFDPWIEDVDGENLTYYGLYSGDKKIVKYISGLFSPTNLSGI